MVNFQLLLLSAVSVTGIADWLKTFDKEKKLKKYYNLLPLVLSILTSFGVALYTEGGVNYGAWIIYFTTTLAISTLAYDTIIEWVKTKISRS